MKNKHYIKSISFLLLFSGNLYCQNDSITKKVISIFEVNCPYYVLEYYCTRGGLEEILIKAKTDDRVALIKKVPATHEIEERDSSIEVHYYNSVIVFEKYKGSWDVGPFVIYVKNQKDLEYLGRTYSLLMGFKKDDETKKTDGLTARYADKEYPMNAILTYEYPKEKLYYAQVFAWQYGFCK